MPKGLLPFWPFFSPQKISAPKDFSTVKQGKFAGFLLVPIPEVDFYNVMLEMHMYSERYIYKHNFTAVSRRKKYLPYNQGRCSSSSLVHLS